MEEMGMTDLQFKDHLRGIIAFLNGALAQETKEETDEKIKELLERFKIAVED